MNRIVFAASALLIATFAIAPAHAQATRTWVSGVGDDVNPCSRTAPCKSFAGAISKTAANGEINCLDPGGFGTVTITKSLTIDCAGTLGSILNAGTSGIVINDIASTGITVNLRNLSLNGAGTGTIGINIIRAVKVNIENVVVANNTQQGIKHASTWGGSMVVIKDSTISNNTQAGISITAPSTSGLLVDNVVSKQNQYGVAVSTGNLALVSRSNLSNNTTAGVELDSGAQAMIENSTINNNSSGIQNGGTATVANSALAYNTTAVSGAGTTTSFGNNRLFGNASVGTALTPAGAASTDLGQK